MMILNSELLPDSALKSCWAKIESLKAGETLIVKDVAPNKSELWIACAKQWIDVYKQGEFSTDYSVFKRLMDIDTGFTPTASLALACDNIISN